MHTARKIALEPYQVLANPKSQIKSQRGHVVARTPIIDIFSAGRLRTGHVLAICSISHSTLYARMKAGTFPAPDGRDGGLNFWNTSTIRSYLEVGDTI
jgi:predicted DNA-binding transcriptional regulator AlpA